MFTGLVECTAPVVGITPSSGGARLIIQCPFAHELVLGDSVAVNGCCLTVDALHTDAVEFDLLGQTLRVTSLGALVEGSLVNLERAMGAGGRFGGHFVMGHVDTTATLVEIRPQGQDHIVEVEIPQEYAKYCIDKGSITLDGISLTIANLRGNRLEFWITPHTYQRTLLYTAQPGQPMNIEVDMLAKYVENFFNQKQ